MVDWARYQANTTIHRVGAVADRLQMSNRDVEGEVTVLVGSLSAPQSPEDRLVTATRLLDLLSADGSSELIEICRDILHPFCDSGQPPPRASTALPLCGQHCTLSCPFVASTAH